jgi:uncharacterized membrane protein YccC
VTCFPTAIGILVGLALALLAWIIVRKVERDMEGY